MECKVIVVDGAETPPTPGWYVLWAPTGFGGTTLRMVEIEHALRRYGESSTVWYPMYPETEEGRTVMRAVYPGYMFIHCLWDPGAETAVQGCVPVFCTFLKDDDTRSPFRVSDEIMAEVKSMVETFLDQTDTQGIPAGFEVGDNVRVVNKIFAGHTGRVSSFKHGRVIVEIPMFGRDVPMMFDAKDLQRI